MKVLLTGASGFIGRDLVPLLRESGDEIVLLSRLSSTVPATPFEEIRAELEDWPMAIRGRNFDTCIHLAWIATPGVYLESPENKRFAEATSGLARQLFKDGLKHFVGLGSCIEYAPDQTAPCVEEITPVEPLSEYGRWKHRAHQEIAAAAAGHGAGHTWVRLFYPYGAGEHEGRIPTVFLRTLAAGKPLHLKTPFSVKDFIEIQDVAHGLARIAGSEPCGPLNLGSASGIEIRRLAEIAARLTGADPALISHGASPDPYGYHVADGNRMHSAGIIPRCGLVEGMERLYRSFEVNV